MLPDKVGFEGYAGTYRYVRLGFRTPRKGEHYLSGAVVYAYRAPNDLSTPFHIVKPVGKLRRFSEPRT